MLPDGVKAVVKKDSYKVPALFDLLAKEGDIAEAVSYTHLVVEHLYNRECNGKVVINDEIKSAIDKYYEQYGAK